MIDDMTHAAPLTKLERRTALLLTIIGILGSLLAVVIAIPYFYVLSTAAGMCDAQCPDANTQNAQLMFTCYTTASIILGGMIVSLLPRIVYGVKLRKAKQSRKLADGET